MPLDETKARYKTIQLDEQPAEMSTARWLQVNFKMDTDSIEAEKAINGLPDAIPVDVPEMMRFSHIVTDQTRKTTIIDANICIYCGYDPDKSDEKRALTEEHIIPESIGGKLVAKHACCSQCQGKIQKYEDKINSFLLFAPARQMGIKGKDNAKHRKRKELYILDMRLRDRNVKVKLSSDEHPTHLILPYLNIPQSIAKDTKARAHVAGFWIKKIEPGSDIVKKYGAVGFSATIDVLSFCQYIAKIAYSYIASLALLHNEFFLNGLISGALPTFGECIPEIGGYVIKVYTSDQHDMSIFMFSGGDPVAYKKSDFLHGLGHSIISDRSGTRHAVVYIRLFGNLGAPIYVCVIGKVPKRSDQPIRF